MKYSRLLACAIASASLTTFSQAITIYGVGIDNQLYQFDTSNPGGATAVGGNLAGIVDIDFRGSGVLYGMAGSGETFSIDFATGTLTSLFTPASDLGGSVTKFDFNPAADRMRVLVGGTTNFRIVPDGISGATAGTVVVDGSFAAPTDVSILGLGYTNPFGGLAGDGNTTVLYSIGSDGILYTHSVGPEFNTMTAIGSGLGFTIDSAIGFDIGSDGIGYLTHGSEFYTVDLGLGTASFVGDLGVSMSGIAIVPEPSSLALGALAGLGLLRRKR